MNNPITGEEGVEGGGCEPAAPQDARPTRRPRGSPITVDTFRERSTVDANGCWIWRNAIGDGGYGVINIGHRTTSAHRAAFIAATGRALTSDIDVCHRCDVRACVNPDHLFEGTRADNMADCASKGRICVPLLEGEASPNSKLTAAEVLSIRADPRSNRAVAREWGVDKGTIAAIRHRLTWRSI